MRPIDAEKIDFSEVFVGSSDFAKDTRAAAQMLINKQQTVDATNHGKWSAENGETVPHCSECHGLAIFTSGHFYLHSDYCPHCGSKMDLT